MIDPDGMWASGGNHRWRLYADMVAAQEECNRRTEQILKSIGNSSGMGIDMEAVFVLQELTGGSGGIGSVSFEDDATEAIVREAMKNDIEFAKKILDLSKSNMDYLFKWTGVTDVSLGGDIADYGSFSPDENTGTPIIEFSTIHGSQTDGVLSSLYHETEHAVQFENGKLGFVQVNGKWQNDPTMYDITDEVGAVKAGMNAPGYNTRLKQKFLSRTPAWQAKEIAN